MIIWGMISCLTGKWHMKNYDVWWLMMMILRGNSEVGISLSRWLSFVELVVQFCWGAFNTLLPWFCGSSLFPWGACVWSCTFCHGGN